MIGYPKSGPGASPFPMRQGTPNSQQVGYLPQQEVWQADWDGRYADEAAKQMGATQSRELVPTAEGYQGPEGGYVGLGVSKNGDYNPFATTSPTGGSHRVGVDSDGYISDFSALNAEKDTMIPKFENQIRQQQAYDVMSGSGMTDGLLNASYEDPMFGLITGQTQDQYAPTGVGAQDLTQMAYSNLPGGYIVDEETPVSGFNF